MSGIVNGELYTNYTFLKTFRVVLGKRDAVLKLKKTDVTFPYKNSSGDEIANILVNDDIAHT